MELNRKQEKLKQKIDEHLRNMTRQLIMFDTLEETLNYLLETFYKEFTCDLVGVILNENNRLTPKVWIGDYSTIQTSLNLDLSECSPNLLEDALWGPNDKEKSTHCEFRKALEKEKFSTWFTVPLKNYNKSLGLCVIGFRDFVPLIIEAEKIFAEFGRDVATAMDLAQEKEKQKRKINGIEWIRENIFPGSSIEQLIEKIVERAGRGTHAKGACVYLFDDINNCFTLHQPIYGSVETSKKIIIHTNQVISNYFPYVEKIGGDVLTVPLIVNLRTIGVLYACKDEGDNFSEEDLDYIKFVSTFVSMQIENARLYKNESESKKRLERILEYNQELVKKTVDGEDIQTITKTISLMLEKSVLLYDRFLKPITSYFKEEESHLHTIYEAEIFEHKQQIVQLKSRILWIEHNDTPFAVWPIVGGNNTLGFLAVCIRKNNLDRFLRLTLDYALNVYAMEFMKHKLVLDAKEQVQESFVNQLFYKTIDDQDKIIQYATLINWNLLEPHTIGLFSLEPEQVDEADPNVVVFEGYKARLWEEIKTILKIYDSNMIFTRKGDEFILIVKTMKEKHQSKSTYWANLYQRIKDLVKKESPRTKIHLGIDGPTDQLKDYYYCYLKAAKAKNVVSYRYKQEGGYSFYDQLGSYTILNNTSDRLSAELFVGKNLAPLIKYSEKNNVDLLNTLYVFLSNNGNFRDASKQLYIHRSTLEYRMERVSDLLDIDINDADMRFELMMAYKLYSLFNFSPDQIL
jgi:DNA-binding PucR family transcriptional regulator